MEKFTRKKNEFNPMSKEEFMKKEIERQREIEGDKIFKKFRVVTYEQKKSGGYPFSDFETDNFFEAVSFGKQRMEEQKKYRPDSEYLWVSISEFQPIHERSNVIYPYRTMVNFGENDIEDSKFENGGVFASKDYDVIVKLPNGLTTKKDFEGFSKREVIEWCEIRGWKYNSKGEKEGGYILEDYEFFVKRPRLVSASLPNNKTKMANYGALIGNQKRIDINKNGKIDAEDFTLLRGSMNGAWRNEHKYVNHSENHEVRYARKHTGRSGYKGKRNFEDGGSLNYLSDLWFAVQQKDTDDYKMLSKNLDRLNVPFSIQNEVSADAETQRGRKSLNIPEVHERIKKILEKNETKFATGGGLTFSEKSSAIAKKFEGQAVAPKYQRMYGKKYDKEEAKEVGNKITGKMVAMGMDKKVLGGFFGKSAMVSTPKVSLEEKQVMLKSGEWVQVLDHSGDSLMVMDLNKLGTGVKPMRINISQVDTSSFMAGGKVVKSKPTTKKSSEPTKRGGAMQLAKEIRKVGEKWTDAVKRASAQLKK